MNDDRSAPGLRMPKEPALLGILALLCLFLFFFHLGGRPLWNIDESLHAETSKDILLSGDWIVPRSNGMPFYDKPIFFNWVGAICFWLLGLTDFAARLPAAMFGTLCVFATYWLGRRMFGVQSAFLGAVVLATSMLQLILSRTVVHDIALSFAVIASLAAFYPAYHDERNRGRNLLLFYFFLAVGFLAKGPVGIVLPGIPIGLTMLADRRLGFLREMKLLWGIVILLVVAAPWYVAISVVTGDYFEYFFIGKNFGAFTEGKPFKEGPVYYYLPILVGGLFPWAPVLPIALWRAFRARRTPSWDGILPPGERIRKFRRFKHSTDFYTDRRSEVFTTYDQFEDALASSERVYILIDVRELDELRRAVPGFHIVARSGRDLVASNREGAIPGAPQD